MNKVLYSIIFITIFSGQAFFQSPKKIFLYPGQSAMERMTPLVLEPLVGKPIIRYFFGAPKKVENPLAMRLRRDSEKNSAGENFFCSNSSVDKGMMNAPVDQVDKPEDVLRMLDSLFDTATRALSSGVESGGASEEEPDEKDSEDDGCIFEFEDEKELRKKAVIGTSSVKRGIGMKGNNGKTN